MGKRSEVSQRHRVRIRLEVGFSAELRIGFNILELDVFEQFDQVTFDSLNRCLNVYQITFAGTAFYKKTRPGRSCKAQTEEDQPCSASKTTKS